MLNITLGMTQQLVDCFAFRSCNCLTVNWQKRISVINILLCWNETQPWWVNIQWRLIRSNCYIRFLRVWSWDDNGKKTWAVCMQYRAQYLAAPPSNIHQSSSLQHPAVLESTLSAASLGVVTAMTRQETSDSQWPGWHYQHPISHGFLGGKNIWYV